ncbi:MAG: hypothetical protein QXQ11_09190 [Candidatus Bathyarchaeia archaeon]
MLADDGIYSYVKVIESELEDAVIRHSKDVFGEESIYFPIK